MPLKQYTSLKQKADVGQRRADSGRFIFGHRYRVRFDYVTRLFLDSASRNRNSIPEFRPWFRPCDRCRHSQQRAAENFLTGIYFTSFTNVRGSETSSERCRKRCRLSKFFSATERETREDFRVVSQEIARTGIESAYHLASSSAAVSRATTSRTFRLRVGLIPFPKPLAFEISEGASSLTWGQLPTPA